MAPHKHILLYCTLYGSSQNYWTETTPTTIVDFFINFIICISELILHVLHSINPESDFLLYVSNGHGVHMTVTEALSQHPGFC